MGDFCENLSARGMDSQKLDDEHVAKNQSIAQIYDFFLLFISIKFVIIEIGHENKYANFSTFNHRVL